MKTDTKKVVSVMSFNSVMEAQLYKALLESAGIYSRMQNDLAAQVMPAFGSLMQVNLLVAEEDQRKAREIIGAKFDIDEFHRQSEASKREPTATDMAQEARKAKIAEKKATAVAASKKAGRKAPAAAVKKQPAKEAAVKQEIVPKKSAPPESTVKKASAAKKPAAKKDEA